MAVSCLKKKQEVSASSFDNVTLMYAFEANHLPSFRQLKKYRSYNFMVL